MLGGVTGSKLASLLTTRAPRRSWLFKVVGRQALAVLFVCGFGVGAASASPITLELTTGGATLPGAEAHRRAPDVPELGQQPTGIGVTEPLLPLQQNIAEQASNSNLSNPLDVLSLDLGVTEYRQFLLDIDRADKDSLLSLTQTPAIPVAADSDDHTLVQARASDVPMPGFAAARWIEAFSRNDGVAGHASRPDDARNPGIGGGDVYGDVANALVARGDSHVILGARFGPLPGVDAINASVEEASVLTSPISECVGCEPGPPERGTMPASGSLILMGSGLFLAGAVGLGQRRRHHRHRRHRRRAIR